MYLPLCLAIGVCPDEPRSFFMQQYRWCAGNLSLVLRREFWTADITAFQKICFLSGMLYYLFTALVINQNKYRVHVAGWAGIGRTYCCSAILNSIGGVVSSAVYSFGQLFSAL